MSDPRDGDARGAVVVGYDGSEQARLAAFWAAREAASRGCALLVVGSHGRGAVRRALLGSVSHAVLYHAPCSVAIVHRDHDTTTP